LQFTIFLKDSSLPKNVKIKKIMAMIKKSPTCKGRGFSRPTRIRTLTDRTKICSATVTPWVCICGCKYKLKGEYSSTIGIEFFGKIYFFEMPALF
jgi:hypothetical protein